jgi:hypothetical protein
VKIQLSCLVLALVACSDATQTAPTQLNLDRPVDVSFACYGGLRIADGTPDVHVDITAQPIASCNIRSGERATPTVAPVPPGQEDRDGAPVPSAAWYAFILQSGPGTVGVARFETKPSSLFGGGDVLIQDTDPLTPGRNGISVGEDPIAIATDSSGCYEVIANAGSCDMSVLEVNSAFTSDPVVNRMNVTNAAGEAIRARPTAMAFQPPGGVIGNACPAAPSGIAYVAYPSCHLVAGVDVSTGTIVTGIKFDDLGVPTITDGNVSCPAECDNPMAVTPGVRPVAIDLEQDARTQRVVLAIGADNSNVLRAYDLDPQTFLPLSLSSIPLEDNLGGRLGVTSVAISPVIGMGGNSGMIDDEFQSAQHQFIYAVSNDGTVRVADIHGAPRECDTQVDPRFLTTVRDVDKLSCLTVGDPTTPQRRALARGPGIELIQDAIATSVEIFKVDSIGPTDIRDPGTPSRMIGYFAVVTAANGQTYIVNVDNDDRPDFVTPMDPNDATINELSTAVPLVIPHQLRDAVAQRSLLNTELVDGQTRVLCDDPGPDPDSQGGNIGGPRSFGNPGRAVPAGTIAPEKTGGLPSIRQVLCQGDDSTKPVSELSFAAPKAVRIAEFPDLRALRSDEVWSLTWEGSLSLDKVDTAIDGPSVRYAPTLVDGAGLHLVDQSRPFCDAGVEPYDVLQMRGCDPSLGDQGCPIGYTCYVHPQSQIAGQGTCELLEEAERLENTCREYFVSMKRYTIGRTKSGELQLLPRKAELRTTPVDGCTDDAQCESLADYALHNVSSLNPKDDTAGATDPKTWVCQADPDRKPKAGTGKRCLLVCDKDSECATGTVCHPNPGAAPKLGYCMEGVVPPQACVNAPQRYELHAGEAFAMLGTRQGYVHSIIADAGGNCVKDPTANPYAVSRIPLDAPACDPAADPVTGRKPDGTFEPNPCKTTVPETEYMLNYVPGTCTFANPDENLITRDAEAIRLHNRSINLTLVDPTYPGDLACHGDRMGNRGRIPLTAPGFQISFRQTAGFLPLTLGIAPSFPVKVIRGPQESIWVVDEGDYLSTSLTTPSTRGKVYRVESRAIGIVNLME